MSAATPRADSLASLSAAGGSGAGATASPASKSRSAPRSRKRLRHTSSSLEFLAGGDGDGAGACPRREPVGGSKSAKRRRKNEGSARVTPGSHAAATADAPPAEGRKRQMSPRSRSKLEGLVKPIQGPYDPIGDGGERGTGGDAANSDGKAGGEAGKSRPKNRAANSARAQEEPDPDHLTPKTQRAVSAQVPPKRSPQVSFSPLDYRPQQGSGGASAENSPHMLESYAEQWAKPSPKKNRGDDIGRDEDYGKSEEEEKHAKASNDRDDEMQELDDPSSSVVSTSSNSENEDEVGDVNKPKGRELVHMANAGVSSPPPRTNETLELEYGRLAFMKSELQHKMNMHKLDAQQVNPWTSPPVAGFEAPPSTDDVGVGEKRSSNELMLSGSRYAQGSSSYTRPSRGDVAFGEMAYQRMMAERRSAQQMDGVRDDYGGGHRDDMHLATRPSSKSRPKKKKKRKRRVVETITRVIHEESEEEGSSSTGGRGGRHRYYLDRQPEAGRYSSGRKGYGEDDVSYDSRERNGGQSYDRRDRPSGDRTGREKSDISSVDFEGGRRRQSSSVSKERGSLGRKYASPAGKKRRQGSASQPSSLEALD